MNLNDILSAMPPQFIVLAVLLFFAGIILQLLNTPQAKGKRGERAVKSSFTYSPNAENHMLNDVTLPCGDSTTQIDHVYISKNGIFCIETKHMTGWIFGDPKQKSWTQVIYKKKTRFQNPLRQNYKHTETLRTLLNLPKNSVHSVIAFTGDATFKTPMPDNVGTLRECLAYIKEFQTPVFSKEETEHILQTIQSGHLEPTRATHRLHVQNLRTGNSARQDPHNPRVQKNEPLSPVCPKCGADMRLRTARKGPNPGSQFWGCSTFPKCKQTRSIDKSGVLK